VSSGILRRSHADDRMLDNDEPLLRRGWHPVAAESDLGEEPLRVVLLGEAWVVAQADTELHAFIDSCPHRRARLSGGSVEGRELVCPYHGYRFALGGPNSGLCTAIPVLGDDHRPPRLGLRAAWGVKRGHGLIWIAPEEPVGGFPELPHFDREGLAIAVIRRTTTVSAGLLIDNFLDVAHFSYMHEQTLGASAPVTIDDYAAVRSEWTATLRHRTLVRPTGGAAGSELQRCATYTFTPPFTVGLDIDFEGGPREAAALTVQAESAERSTAWVLVSWPDDDPDGHAAATEFSRRVLEEDLAILEDIDDPRLPLDPRAEFHTRGDRAGVYLRRILGDYLQAASEPLPSS
jgi:phenylpropionate dioxygenase-like ring-hydroxylating dioxygenase large terminal subunit